MKKNLSLFLLFIIFQTVNAGNIIGTYTLSHFDKTFIVKAVGSKKNKFSVFIEVKGESSDDAYINVNGKDLEKFKQSLLEMKNKFAEWSKTATENNVNKMTRFMEVKFPSIGVHWETPSGIYFSGKEEISPVFSIMDDGTHRATIAKTVKHAMNRFITETIYLPFSNPEEIDGLVNLLDKDKIMNIIDQQIKLQKLFD